MTRPNKPAPPIPYLETENLDPAVANIFSKLQRSMGIVPSIYRVMGHAPAVLEASQTWTAAISKSQELRIKEIAYIHTSAINQCEYCLMFHRKIGATAGLTPEQLKALEETDREDWSLFSPTEQNIIQFARAWTLRLEIPRTLIDQLHQDLGPAGVVALAATVHQANWTNRFSTLFVPKPSKP